MCVEAVYEWVDALSVAGLEALVSAQDLWSAALGSAKAPRGKQCRAKPACTSAIGAHGNESRINEAHNYGYRDECSRAKVIVGPIKRHAIRAHHPLARG